MRGRREEQFTAKPSVKITNANVGAPRPVQSHLRVEKLFLRCQFQFSNWRAGSIPARIFLWAVILMRTRKIIKIRKSKSSIRFFFIIIIPFASPFFLKFLQRILNHLACTDVNTGFSWGDRQFLFYFLEFSFMFLLIDGLFYSVYAQKSN